VLSAFGTDLLGLAFLAERVGLGSRALRVENLDRGGLIFDRGLEVRSRVIPNLGAEGVDSATGRLCCDSERSVFTGSALVTREGKMWRA
jgi:hypothetical protein